MPTRKQRRRQQKSRRHEYEYVYVDDEGHEIEVDEADLPETAATNGKRKAERKPTTRSGRTIEPPSWRRVAKRALIFAPLMFITVTLLAADEMTTEQKVMQTIFLLAIFLPFSYVMDSITYRMWRKRTERDAQR